MNVEKWENTAVLSELPIGLFDSGLGGLTVLKELRKSLPNERFVYLGDTARTPYGSKGPATILRYARECTEFLRRSGIKLLVVACNSASSVALEALEEDFPYPIVGTIDPAVKAAMENSKNGRIGLIGTNATIASAVYQRKLHEANSAIQTFSCACPLFVPLVEEGILSGEIVNKTVEHYLAPIKTQNLDTVILGCTHYPLLKESIASFFGPGVSVIECSRAIACEVKELLSRWRLAAPEKGPENHTNGDRYFVTDEVSRFNFLAEQFLGGCAVEAVRVEQLAEDRRG